MTIASSKGVVSTTQQLSRRIEVARGLRPAELVIRGAQWLDVFSGQWRSGDVAFDDGVIVGVGETYEGRTILSGEGLFLAPGFIDAHVHIESSMMTPGRFAEAVLPRGTTTVMWDPHEIANVKGKAGIDWALASTDRLPLDVFVMVPSCVPSTSPKLGLETSGAELSPQDLSSYVHHPRVRGLAEMMNWPGLLAGDDEVSQKLMMFQNKRRDGHCPGLKGKDLNAYAVAGIHSCHESTTLSEADEKISKGIHVLVREGSCAKDADVLLPLLSQRSACSISFCSDDRNPLDIEESGHIDCIVNKALMAGHDPIEVLRAASFAPARTFGLEDRGAIAPGFLGDVIILEQLKRGEWKHGIRVKQVLKRGVMVDQDMLLASQTHAARADKPLLGPNINFGGNKVGINHFAVLTKSQAKEVPCHVIGVRPGQIVTDRLRHVLPVSQGAICADPSRDILKIAVFERHHGLGHHGVALVQGFGLKTGAIATSINHDCHNVIVTGSSDELMAKAVAALCEIDGGIVVVSEDGSIESLKLPMGGLMTHDTPQSVSGALKRMKRLAASAGCQLSEPFLQLSFLALPVIPSLKITDRGLVDGETFKIIPVTEE